MESKDIWVNWKKRQNIDGGLRRVGSSIAAVEVFALMRVIDYFEVKEYVDKFSIVGLSYGGFYSMMTAAIDTRIKSCVTCSQFNAREKYSWVAEKFGDAEIATLIYPRRLYIAVGYKDKLFDASDAESEFKRIKKICEPVGDSWVKFQVFEGEHEFIKSDEPIKNLF